MQAAFEALIAVTRRLWNLEQDDEHPDTIAG